MENGLRKSRTLVSCHLAGANTFGNLKYHKLLKILKVKEKS